MTQQTENNTVPTLFQLRLSRFIHLRVSRCLYRIIRSIVEFLPGILRLALFISHTLSLPPSAVVYTSHSFCILSHLERHMYFSFFFRRNLKRKKGKRTRSKRNSRQADCTVCFDSEREMRQSVTFAASESKFFRRGLIIDAIKICFTQKKNNYL